MKKAAIIEDDVSMAIPQLNFAAICELNEQSAYNRSLAAHARRCGCFHCGSMFDYVEIEKWLEEADGEDTVLCPYCEVDAVIVGTDEFPLSTALLSKLYMEWFEDECERAMEEGNCAPSYRGKEEFFRKGIPFQFFSDPNIEVLGSIDLFYSPLFDEDWDEVCESVGGDVPEDGWLGGVLSVKAYTDEEGFDCNGFFDSCERRIPYEPWTGEMMNMLDDLAEQYGDRLKGFVKSPFTNKLQLFIRNDR